MVDTGYIETVPARDLRVGDVFSTDSGVVMSVTLLQGGGPADEVAVETVCHGIGKSAYLAPDFPCHLWRKTA